MRRRVRCETDAGEMGAHSIQRRFLGELEIQSTSALRIICERMHVIYHKILPLHAVPVHEVTALGVLCCFALFVCLTLLASFFLPSHLSFKNMHTCAYHQIMQGIKSILL